MTTAAAMNERRETRGEIEFLRHLDEIFPDGFGAGGADGGQFWIAADVVRVFPAAFALGAACAVHLHFQCIGICADGLSVTAETMKKPGRSASEFFE